MARYVALLRGINIGPRNRIAMPALREALEEAGFEDVQTYVQSGNVVLTSRAKAEAVRRCLEGPVSPLAPASILQTHGNATVYLDRESAALLTRKPGSNA